MAKKKKEKNLAAQMLGRLGGKSRAKKMTKKQLSDAARKAIQARWEKEKNKNT